jgi:hypothetical protein
MDHPLTAITTAAALRALAASPAPQATSATPADCSCRLAGFTGWDSITEDRWPASQMQEVADLRTQPADGSEPTFTEYHPDGTRYDSPAAPIALGWFPVNRSTVWRCQRCGLLVLRYTEFGGYYVDHRVRVLKADCVADAPPAPLG